MNASTQQAPLGPGGAPQSHGGSSPCSCTHERRVLLVPYVCATCTDDEALAFEAHLLMCGECFEDVKVLDRAGILIREFADSKSEGLARLLAERKRVARKNDA